MPRVTVKVIDADTNIAIPWIKGSIGGKIDNADEKGVLEWFDIPPGNYKLIVKTTFYLPHIQTITVKDTDLDLGTIKLVLGTPMVR